MQYRTFGKTGENVSLLGFGAMRLPTVRPDTEKIDVDESVKMIRSAIDAGVNYIDTAYIYHGGDSEVFLKTALADGYREKVFLADKFPIWDLKSNDDLERIFGEQLARLGVDMIDFYLVHNIDEGNAPNFYRYNVFDFIQKKQAEGKVRHIGFSTHCETFEYFKELLDKYPWEFVQLQLNYMDKEMQAGLRGLRYAGEKNIPVVVMEPLKGGKLTDNIPESIQRDWAEAEIKRSPADWAFRWVGNFPEVLTILSGMSTQQQVDENIEIFREIRANSLTPPEIELIDKVADEYNRLIPYSCTACKYCMSCPQKLNIPWLISYRNEWTLYANNPKMKLNYKAEFASDVRASACTHCKQCETKCPQHLPISGIMTEVQEIFE